MARSSYIYVVQWNGGGSADMATFTVKWEAVEFVKRGIAQSWLDAGDIEIFRLRDGEHSAPTHYSVDVFLYG